MIKENKHIRAGGTKRTGSFGLKSKIINGCGMVVVSASVFLQAAAPSATAAVFTWDGEGANNNWGTAANWNAAVPTGNLDTDLVFTDGTLRSNPFLNSSDYKVRSITFGAGGSGFNITGETGKKILLQTGGGITNLSGVSQTINVSILDLESGSQTWNIASGDLNITGAQLGLKSSSRLTIAGGGNVLISSQIYDSGGLTKSGAGTLTLSGANNYTGTTTNSGGVLLLNSSGALSGSSHLVLNGGVVGLGAANFTRSLGTGSSNVRFTGSGGFAAYNADRLVNLGGTGPLLTWGSTANFLGAGQNLILGAADATHTVTFQNPIDFNGASRTVQVNDGAASVDGVLDGVLSGTGGSGLQKTGEGTLSVTAANTYAGGTIVEAGTLLVNNTTGSGTGSGAVTVNDGGTLGGSGSISGDITLNPGAAISPGESPGQLNTGNQTWSGGSAFVWEINDVDAGAGIGWDLLNTDGALTLDATSINKVTIDVRSLTLANVAGPVHDFDNGLSYDWRIITTTGGILFNPGENQDTVFDLLLANWSNETGGGTFSLGLANGGNDLILSFNPAPVPEPGTYGMILLGVLALLVGRRFLRR